MNFGFTSAAIICCVCVLGWVVKSEKGARSFFVSAFQGLAALFAVNLLGLISGVKIAVNFYTLSAFTVLGLPGVIGALTMNLLMRP